MTAILDPRNADRLPEPAYDRDGITVYLGDCRTILPMLDAVDHVITDPPYSEQVHEGARTLRDLDTKPVTFASTTSLDLAVIAANLSAITARWFVATMAWEHVTDFLREPPCGWEFIRHGVWVKPDGAPQFTGDRPAQGWEAVCIMHRPGKKRWNGGGNRAVWTHNVVRGQHPTEKPLSLLLELVDLFTDPGDLVLDPFAGSLTTAVACKQLGRRCIAIEMDAGYVQAGIKRLEATTLPLFVLAPEVVTQEGLGL